MQILVVVANIQARTLKAEVEKGFMRTAIGHELVDPKARINLVNGTIGPACRASRLFPVPKGKQVNIPAFGLGSSGYANDLGYAGQHPRKSSLFFLTVRTSLESL